MNTLNISEIAARLESLKAQNAEIQREMHELGTLLVLAEKYIASQCKSPMTHVAEGALKAMDAAILGAGKSKKDRIIEMTTEILSDGIRRSSRYLVRELEVRGVEISGNDDGKKAAGLAAYLSKAEIFDSNVKLGGWALAKRPKTARPDDVGASSGLFINGSEATHP